MRVVHLKRTFLARTETFIYSQLTRLPPDKAIVLARDVQWLDRFPGLTVHALSQAAPNWRKYASDLIYRVSKQMSPYEYGYFRQEVERLRPNLLHAHYAVDAAYFAALKFALNIPLIVSCYGYDVSSFPRRYFGYGQRYLQRAIKATDLFLAMSADMKEDLLRLGVAEARIMIHHPNGVDLERYTFAERRPTPNQPITILSVGTFEERKGIPYLIEAFARIKKQRGDVQLRLIGDGPLRPQIEAQIRALALQDSVVLVGFVDHAGLFNELDKAHLFCLPCVTARNGDKEGIPTILVEAQATGLPVVSTWHAGIPDAVVDGLTGYLVVERNVEELTDRLLKLIEHPEDWTRMGYAGRAHINRHFDARRLAVELSEIYEQIVG